MLAYLYVHPVALGLRTAVHGVVLGSGDDAVVMRIVALHAGDKGHAHARGQKRVFAVGLLAAAPAGIAKDIDVGRPEVETFKDVAVACSHRLHMLDAALDADGRGHLVDGRSVEGGGQADGLRKFCGSVAHDAVQRLAPPVVGGHVKPGNGTRLIYQLRDLLIQLHAAYQVGCALLRRQAGV